MRFALIYGVHEPNLLSRGVNTTCSTALPLPLPFRKRRSKISYCQERPALQRNKDNLDSESTFGFQTVRFLLFFLILRRTDVKDKFPFSLWIALHTMYPQAPLLYYPPIFSTISSLYITLCRALMYLTINYNCLDLHRVCTSILNHCTRSVNPSDA